jgi:hypothetical protein
MNRKALLLDLALLALAGVLVWQIRQRWLEGQARERAIFTTAAHRMAVLAPPPVTPPKQVMAGEYVEVAQKMLFAKDRNPNVPIEPPPPPPVKPPLPPLPAYYGQMTIGDPVVLLASGNGDQKSYHVGDKIGPFELAAFDQEKIVLKWRDETVERKLADLKPKDATPSSQVAPRPALPAAAKPASSGLTQIGSSSTEAGSNADNGPFGVDVGGGYRGCTPGDKTPAGSVVSGYKKVISRGMFGDVCRWEQVK